MATVGLTLSLSPPLPFSLYGWEVAKQVFVWVKEKAVFKIKEKCLAYDILQKGQFFKINKLPTTHLLCGVSFKSVDEYGSPQPPIPCSP